MERGALGRRARAQAGYVQPGKLLPYGYRCIREGNRAWLEIVEDEARIVRLIFDWYVHGDETGRRMGAQAIASKLSKLGVPSRSNLVGLAKPRKQIGVWGISTIKRILKSQVYAGTWNYSRTRRTSKTTFTASSQNDWIAVPVPAIVSGALWEAAQVKSPENCVVRALGQVRHFYLMRGRLRCAVCGYVFSTYTDIRRAHLPKPYYRCGGQKVQYAPDFATKPCHRSLRQEVWDESIWQALVRQMETTEVLLQILRVRLAQTAERLDPVRGWLNSLERRLGALDVARERLLELYIEPVGIPKELLREKLAQIAAERAQFEREAVALRGRMKQQQELNAAICQVETYCKRVAAGVVTFSDEDKLRVVASLNVTGVVSRGGRPEDDTITLHGYLPDIRLQIGEDTHRTH
ncbi:MAG: site-specific recombinase [Chloroflexia bacterium]|jgi:site-specific DNA recombinase|nr:site-specific recombinase [Chloroflexia bacterium]